MRYLTKSRFALALECPTKLDYRDDPSYASTKQENDFLMALAEGGHQVGALAKCLFPEGIEVDANGHEAQLSQTEALLAGGDVTLFEAAVRAGRLFIRTDILRQVGGALDLYEVKAKGFDPLNPGIVGARGGFVAGMKPYLYDVAFQRHVLRKAFPGVPIRSYLVMPDKTVVCAESGVAQRLRITKIDRRVHVDVDPVLRDGSIARSLLRIVPVDDHLDRLVAEPMTLGRWQTSFDEGIEELERRLGVEPYAPRIGAPCKSCEFKTSPLQRKAGLRDGRQECLAKAFGARVADHSGGTVLDLSGSRKTDALIDAGTVLLVDVEPEDIGLKEEKSTLTASHRQWLQTEEAHGVVIGPVARRAELLEATRDLVYPLHFIDFETSRPALPFHAGRRPYEQILFQYSHHRLDVDGSLRHQSQYLADEGDASPSFSTLRALKAALAGDSGTVLHWWDHERTVLGEVREQLLALSEAEVHDRDELLAFIASLLGSSEKAGRLVDLGRLVHRTVFLPGTRGSSSLKKVLPALLATSEWLRHRYSEPTYGAAGGVPSHNFSGQAWVRFDSDGHLMDPYALLGERMEDPDLAGLDSMEEESDAVADGGAAMVAYGLLQSGLLDGGARERLRAQLLRYCELDTLAMVMAWQGLKEILAQPSRVSSTI